jgi:hypothetical protein
MRKAFLAIAILVLMAAPAFAAVPSQVTGGGVNTALYHSYDGLICTDCHTLHASDRNSGVTTGVATDGATSSDVYGFGAPYRELLKRGDWTDMCLSCHKQGQNTSGTAALPGVENSGWVAPIVMTTDGTDPAGISMPAGDFYWSNRYPKRGHNPAFTKNSMTVATSKMMAADTVLGSTPPGGSIADGEWSCHSCHGMHSRFSGTYTAWRQIKRKVNGIVQSGCTDTVGTVDGNGYCDTAVATTLAGYEAIKSNSRGHFNGGTGEDLIYKVTRKDGNPNEGADLFADESDTNKNVYRGGFSSFCATCHGDFHGGNGETRGTANGKTNISNSWMRHPTNVKMNETAVVMSGSTSTTGSKYGISTYTKAITNQQGNNPNPVGYDWKYPLIQPDLDFAVKSTEASATVGTTALGDSRISCLTCHKAHASQFENMTRWDTNAHSFIASGATDFTGATSIGDNPAYGCGKCHQKGGTKAFVKSF